MGDAIEERVNGQRSQSGSIVSAQHRVRLAGASLTVGENGAVVAFQNIGDDVSGRVVINMLL